MNYIFSVTKEVITSLEGQTRTAPKSLDTAGVVVSSEFQNENEEHGKVN